MGSISKAPKTPTITYVVPTTATPSTDTGTNTTVTATKTDETIRAEAREDSLLRRSRGRFGTIATSFKGFFDSTFNKNEAKPKTLLGE